MKKLLLISSIFLINTVFSQETEKNFTLNSFSLDVGMIALSLDGPNNDINDFIDGKNIGLIQESQNYFNGRNSSAPMLKFNMGFKIGANKNKNQELVFNFTYAPSINIAYYAAYNYQHYAIDTIYQYQVSSQTKDTTYSVIYIDSAVYNRQDLAHYSNMFAVGGQWMFKKDYQRVSYGLAPGFNVGALMAARVYNRYNTYAVVTNSLESYPNEKDSYTTWLKGYNGSFIQPTLQASVELKTKNRNNFLDPLSIIAKVNLGANVVKIKNAPVFTQGILGSSLGLRFEL